MGARRRQLVTYSNCNYYYSDMGIKYDFWFKVTNVLENLPCSVVDKAKQAMHTHINNYREYIESYSLSMRE